MSHPKEELLALAAADDLPFWNGWQVRRHVMSCAECGSAVDAYSNLRVSVSALPVPDPPADLAEGILGRIPRGTSPQPARISPWLVWSAPAAVAAAAVFAVMAIPIETPQVAKPPLISTRQSPPEITPAPVAVAGPI